MVTESIVLQFHLLQSIDSIVQNYLWIIFFLNLFHSFTLKIKHSLENSIVGLIFGRVNVGGPNIVDEHVLFSEHISAEQLL